MDDRKLLELAAKAAGITFMFRQGVPCRHESSGSKAAHLDALGWKLWNPITEIGDRYRLASQCGLLISFNHGIARAYVNDEPSEFFFTPGDDKSEAYAIVKAAAALAKAL